MVFNLCLSQSGMTVCTPVHRLGPAIYRSLVKDGLKNLNIGCIVIGRIRQIRIVPLCQNTKTLKTLALRVNLLNGHLSAEFTNLFRRQCIELLGAEHFLNLMLNGLAVAVPAGDIGGLKTAHGLVAIDDVFGNLVLCMAQVNGAIGIGRTIVEHELLVALVLLHKQLIEGILVPQSQTLGLILRQRCAHGEPRAWQVCGLLILVCHPKQPFWAQKSARPLLLGRSAYVYTSLVTTQRRMIAYSVGLLRRPYPAASTYAWARRSSRHAFELQLQGDFHTDANAGSQLSHSL